MEIAKGKKIGRLDAPCLYLALPVVALSLTGTIAHAETAEQAVIEQVEDLPKNEIVPTAKPTVAELQQATARVQAQDSVARYDLEKLKADAQYFTEYLNAALAAQDMATVQALLPHYKQMPVKDPALIQYADAMVYRYEGKNKQAIAIYKDMLAADPTLHPVRYYMAIALFNDKQYEAAKDQFSRLKSESLPANIVQQINAYLTRLKRMEEWQFNASVSYIKDDNINNVPEKSQTTTFGRTYDPVEANGLSVIVGANKRNNLSDNLYATVGANANIKGYWDESDYNDYLMTLSAGIGYDDAKNDVSLTPFISKRYYDEQAYSTRAGATVRASRWVKPKLRLTGSITASNEQFDKATDANRETDGLFLGVNALYTKNATEYYYGGIGHYKNDVPKVDVLTYDNNSVNLGWGKEWVNGISTLTDVSYAERTYKKSDTPSYNNLLGGPAGAAREDQIYSLGLQLWKRDYTVLGLTPRLVIDYEMTNSNFAYYDDRESLGATVVLTKSF